VKKPFYYKINNKSGNISASLQEVFITVKKYKLNAKRGLKNTQKNKESIQKLYIK